MFCPFLWGSEGSSACQSRFHLSRMRTVCRALSECPTSGINLWRTALSTTLPHSSKTQGHFLHGTVKSEEHSLLTCGKWDILYGREGVVRTGCPSGSSSAIPSAFWMASGALPRVHPCMPTLPVVLKSLLFSAGPTWSRLNSSHKATSSGFSCRRHCSANPRAQ